jgi:RNA polymerase sigma-70 factor, ECF subfamily
MTDREIADQFLRSKSERTFRVLYQSQTARLYATALRLTAGDKFVAEDMIQEMWCIAIKKLPAFEWRASLKTWLTSILINLSKEHYRDEVKKHTESNGHAQSIESSLEIKMDLENALSSLPLGYRTVLILHDVEGYTHEEIAQLLGIVEGTSKSQLFNARKLLREKLK